MYPVKLKIAEKLNIPEDISAGVPIVTIMGNREVFVENYKGILIYEGHCIKLQTKTCRITVEGENLEIIYYTNVEMKIVGDLVSISYS